MTTSALRHAIACISLVVSAAGAAAQQTPPHHIPLADINGEWNGPLELEGGTHDISLVFNLTDSAFVGSIYDSGRRFGDMEHGTLVGDTVRFNVDVLKFTGIVSGKTMKIALIVYNGSTRNFVATKKTTDKGELEPRRE